MSMLESKFGSTEIEAPKKFGEGSFGETPEENKDDMAAGDNNGGTAEVKGFETAAKEGCGCPSVEQVKEACRTIINYLEEADEELGDLKIEKPTEEGIASAIAAENDFVESPDTPIEKGNAAEENLNDALEEAFAFLEEGDEVDIDSVFNYEEPGQVDINTIPADNKEEDQFEEIQTPEEDEKLIAGANVTDSELVDESFTGWSDLDD